MATEENQTQTEASLVTRRASPPAAAPKPSGEVGHANNNQDVQRYSDHLWLSNRRGSPSLLFYRKLSDDSSEGTISNEEYDCLDCSTKVLSANEKTSSPALSAGKSIGRVTNTVTPVPGSGSEGSRCQLDSSEEGVDAGGNSAVRSRCSCTVSSLYTSPDSYTCHSPTSSPASSPSPVHSPHLTSSPSRPSQRHTRRSSLPVSMLAFHTVIKDLRLTVVDDSVARGCKKANN